MFKYNEVLIPLRLDTSDKVLSFCREMNLLKRSHIHLVHFVKDRELGETLGLKPSFYTEDGKVIIEEAVLKKLEEFRDKLISNDFEGKITCECIFTSNIRKSFCELASAIRADLILIPAGDYEKASGSFIRYQLRHSTVPSLIIRP